MVIFHLFHGEAMIKNVYVVRDEEQPIGRLLIEKLLEQRHGATGPTAPISGSLLFAGTPRGKSC